MTQGSGEGKALVGVWLDEMVEEKVSKLV